jgi:hypothetical protein
MEQDRAKSIFIKKMISLVAGHVSHSISTLIMRFNGFRGMNWSKETEKAWKAFNQNIMETADKTFNNELGDGTKVIGFYKKVMTKILPLTSTPMVTNQDNMRRRSC